MLLLLACTAQKPVTAESAAPLIVPWSSDRAPLDELSPQGRRWQRGIIHLHSHFSHDACDGDPMPDGVPDEACLQDLRAGLCRSAIDFAFITDHPAHSAEQEYPALLLTREGDEVIEGIANSMRCDTGADPAHRVLLMPGVEDELMPVGLDRHVPGTPEERDALYNSSDAATIAAEREAGALVFQAHTEGQELSTLQQRQGWGLTGVEIFNLHAMFDPNKRRDDLGLDPFGYIEGFAPFFSGTDGSESDLAFLAVYEEQTISLERWDALQVAAPTVGIAGTDAHQNVLPTLMPDGERGDSYRRMISWFSNVLLTDGSGPADLQAALAAGRSFVAFEVLGAPTGFSVSYTAPGGDPQEMSGSGAAGGTLTVGCAALSPDTPQDGNAPEITTLVFKDGAPFAEGCGDYVLDSPGVYRVRVDIVPHHLSAVLGSAQQLVHSYPWLYSNAFRIGM